MDNPFELLTTGTEIEYQGKKYVRLKDVSWQGKDNQFQHYVLAVEMNTELPAPVVVIPLKVPAKLEVRVKD